ncbi:MAG: CsiV family protein [Pseudomonadota bacterium]
MRYINTPFFWCLAAFILTTSVCDAQVPLEIPEDTPLVDEEAAEPVPEFEIEVIVFEYVGGAVGAREDWAYIDTGRAEVQARLEAQRIEEERIEAILNGTFNEFPEPPPEPEPDEAPIAETLPADGSVPLNEDGLPMTEAQMLEAGLLEDDKPLIWTLLEEEQLDLAEAFERMRNSRDYKPLIHAGWRQPVYGKADATTLALERIADVPDELSAEASIYVERFLHLTLDLELAKPSADSLGSVIYRLDERRKMRSGETHFFDHPRFGAIAIINKPELVEVEF